MRKPNTFHFALVVMSGLFAYCIASDAQSNTLVGAESSVAETIRISASRTQYLGQEQDLYVDLLAPEYAGQTLTEVLNQQSGLGYVGQGGIFQVVSIRGLSGARVRSMFGDIPIFTERRAGNSLSFIDPLYLGDMQIVKGSSSTQYGSGAIGGVIQMRPRLFEQAMTQVELDVNNFSQKYFAAWGDGELSLAASAHNVANQDDAVGNKLFTEYEQYSAMIKAQWLLDGGQEISWVLLPSLSRNIGKSSSDFPDIRVTRYLEEDHWLSYLNLIDPDYGYFSLYLHDQQLITEANRIGSRINTVDNQSTDFGFYWRNEKTLNQTDTDSFAMIYGIDVYRRTAIDGYETELVDNRVQFSDRILSGSETDSALFIELNNQRDRLRFSTGLRFNYLAQESLGQSASGSQLTGFARIDWRVNSLLTSGIGYSQGFRFPSVTERFYDGTTGRGTLQGNPDLRAERSDNLEWNMNLQASKDVSIYLNAHYQAIDNFIERITLENEINSFANQSNVDITGLELGGRLHFLSDYSLTLQTQWLDAKNEFNQNINDLPKNRISVDLSYHSEQMQWAVASIYEAKKDDPGASELEREAAFVFNAYYRLLIAQNNALTLRITNAFNEDYAISADEKSTLAPERTIHAIWQKHF